MNSAMPAVTMSNRPLPPCPRLIMAAALLLWGMSNKLLPLAVALAVALEVAAVAPKKPRLPDKDRNRLCDLTMLTVAAYALQQFYSNAHEAIFSIVRLLPLLLAPIMLVQCWAENGNFRYSSLFWSVRLTERRNPQWDYGRIDLRLPYVCICMTAAAMHSERDLVFMAGASIMAVWLLWPRHGYNRAWLLAIAAAVALSLGGQYAVLETRKALRPLLYQLTHSYIKHRRNPWSNKPHLDSISRLKFSGRIALRAEPAAGIELPILLHEASYDTFSGSTWKNSSLTFTEIDATADGDGFIWQWRQNCDGYDMDIQFRLNQEVSVIPLPYQSCLMDRLPAVLQRHPYGTTKLSFQKGWVGYSTRMAQSKELVAAAPSDKELLVPTNLRREMRQFIAQAGLAEMQPRDAIASLKRHFIDEFSYSIEPSFGFSGDSRIGSFLLHEKSGHCELFATATAMILRELGIPSRYAVGFVLDEYSPLEGKYIARGRHAHAWTMAWIDNGWQVVDTTPPGFAALDEQQGLLLQPVLDLIELLLFEEIDVQALLGAEENQARNLTLILLPLTGFLLWRLHFRRRRAKAEGRGQARQDSPFYQITALLEKGNAKSEGQTLGNWIRHNWPELEAELQPLLAMHYQLRFGKYSEELKHNLQRGCKAWLQQRQAKGT